jgi:uncharacterized OsmC-like protein
MSATADRSTRPHPGVLEAHKPLRELYPREPEQAISLKRARTSGVAGTPWHGEVEIGDGYGVTLRFAADRKVGGPHDAPNPPEIMSASVAACEHLTIQMIADLLRIELEQLEVSVTGEVDVRGTLMISDEPPIGFRSMRCEVKLRCAPGTDERRMKMLTEYAERSCVTLATAREGVEVECSVDAR